MSPVKADNSKCGTQERCIICECSRIDARLCLPCEHRFCPSCVENIKQAADRPTLISCPICNCDVDRQRNSCNTNQQSQGNRTPAPCDEWYCYNCFTEGSGKSRAKEFCLDCDVSMCDKHLQQHKAFIRKKKHSMLPVAQYKLMKRKFETRHCKIHAKQTLMFVCGKCDMIVCQVCVACCDCDKGGRHEAYELDTIAMEMASTINKGIRKIDCVLKSGENAVCEAQRVQQRKETELEKLKKAVCAEFEAKIAEVTKTRGQLLADVSELIKRNRRATTSHKNKVKELLCHARDTATRASQLLCYSHNVDIASDGKSMQHEVECINKTTFPCLELEGYKLTTERTQMVMPSLCQDSQTITNFCPQPEIPEPLAEDPCDTCSRPKSPCPTTANVNPRAVTFSSNSPPCPPGNRSPLSYITGFQEDPCKMDELASTPHIPLLAEDPCQDMIQTDPCDTATSRPKEPPRKPARNFTYKGPDFSTSEDDSECEKERKKCAATKDLMFDYGKYRNDYRLAQSDCNEEMSTRLSDEDKICKQTIKMTVHDGHNLTAAASKKVTINDLTWHITVCIQQKQQGSRCVDYLALFVQCENPCQEPYWSCQATIELKLVNQIDPSCTECRETAHKFCEENPSWGFKAFMKLSDVLDQSGGFCKRGRLLIEARVAAQPKQCGV